MTASDLILLSPFIIVSIAVLAVMLAATVWKSRVPALAFTLAGLAAALVACAAALSHTPAAVTPLLLVNGFSLYYTGLVLACSLGVVLLSMGYFARPLSRVAEFCLFLLLSTLGAMVIVSSAHFASLFLGFELQSVALYPLVAYKRNMPQSIEAGIKYLVPSTVAGAFLVFGMALVYADTGSLIFAGVAALGRLTHPSALATAGLLMILSGLAFKLALVPFHFWTPDVYQGAPAPATAFVATVTKVAAVALLVRFFSSFTAHGHNAVTLSLWSLAIVSMFIGNLLALRQESVKRIIAYSSISHMGYVMVAFLCGTPLAAVATTYYVTAYVITVLGALAAVMLLSQHREADMIDDFRGFGFRNPIVAFVLAVSLLSLAGIPLTIGFIGKFYVVSAGVQSRVWPLTLSLIVSSAIGLYYYLRIVIALYRESPSAAPEGAVAARLETPVSPLSFAALIVLGATGVLIVCFGVYPGPLFDIILRMIGS